MLEILKRRLRECGIDVDVMAASKVLARLPQVDRAIYICKDTKGCVRLTGVPETEWHFEGTIYLVDGVMFLIDKTVAREWEAKAKGSPKGSNH